MAQAIAIGIQLILVLASVYAAYTAIVAAHAARKDASIGRLNQDELALANNRIDTLAAGIRRIEGRVAKQGARSGTLDGEPDPKTDPEGWKRWKNKQIGKGRNLQ